MFDVTSKVTYVHIPKWYTDFTRVCSEGVPIVLIGNKVDVMDRKVRAKDIKYHRKKNIQYYDVSAKSNYNYEKPFVYIMRKLSGSPELHLVEQPTVSIPEVAINPTAIAQMNKELEIAATVPLDDGDDF